MCRLFGYRSAVPGAVHHSLLTDRNSLLHQSREHPDGWGIASYGLAEGPSLSHGLDPAHSDPEFDRVCKDVNSHTVLAHIRLASVGKVEVQNAHPFFHGRWAFAHNGTVVNFVFHQAKIEALIDADLLAHIRGSTDSERCFYLFLSELRRRSPLERAPSVEAVARALVATMDQVSGLTDHGDPRSSMNFVATNGEVLVATRRLRSLFFTGEPRVLSGPPFDTLRANGGPVVFPRGGAKSIHGELVEPWVPRGPSFDCAQDERATGTPLLQFLLASEVLSPHLQWQEVPEESVVGVDAQLHLHRWPLSALR